MSRFVEPSFMISYPTTRRECPSCCSTSGILSVTVTGERLYKASCTVAPVPLGRSSGVKYAFTQSSRGLMSAMEDG